MLADFLLRRRWSILLLLVVISGFATWQAIHVSFDFTPQAIYASDDEEVDFSEKVKETFGYEDATLLVLLEATGDQDTLTASALEWQTRFAVRAKRLPEVVDVLSIPTLQLPQVQLFRRKGFSVTPLVEKLPITEDDERAVRETVAGNELLTGTLISNDARLVAMVVVLEPDARLISRLRDVVGDVHQLVDKYPPPDGYRIRYGGLAALRLDIIDNLWTDLQFVVPVSGVVLLLSLIVTFRSLAGTLLPLLAVGMGLAWTIGFLVTAGEQLNVISNVLPILLMVIGVSNCVHLMSRFAEESQRHPEDRSGATLATIRPMSWACLLTYLTTAIGFLSLLMAQSHVLQGFGWQAALGMGLLYLTTIAVHGTLLPSFHGPPVGGSHSPVGRFVALAGYFVAKSPRGTMVVCLLVIGGSLFLARNIEVDSYQIETYDEDHPMM